MHHAGAQRNKLCFPLAFPILLPHEVLHGNPAKMRLADVEAVDPAAESAYDSGVTYIVIHCYGVGIEIFEHDIEIPDRGSNQADAGVRVIHRSSAVSFIQSS